MLEPSSAKLTDDRDQGQNKAINDLNLTLIYFRFLLFSFSTS
jgi:hypothetical protein